MASAKFNYNVAKSNIDNSQLANAFAPETHQKSLITMMCIDDIKLDPKGEFNSLFPIDDTDVENITKSMESYGFDKSKALDIATINEESDTQEHPILIEGHQRLLAAQKADIEQVPVYLHTYETRREALISAVLYQLNRRNLTTGDKVKAFELLDTLKNRGRKSDGNDEPLGKSVEGISDKLGISARTGEKIRDVLQNGDDETKTALKNNELSINKAWQITNAAKKANKSDKDISDQNSTTQNDFAQDTQDDTNVSNLPSNNDTQNIASAQSYSSDSDVSNALGSSEGSPASLNFNHSDGIERPKKLRDDSDPTDILLREKNQQIESAQKEYFAKGFQEGVYFVLSKVMLGRSANEILTDERLNDLTAEGLWGFEVSTNDKNLVKGAIDTVREE